MTKFETIFWWIGISVCIAAMACFLCVAILGDWKIGIRALAPLLFLFVMVESRRSIIKSRETMAECDKLLRKIGKNNTK